MHNKANITHQHIYMIQWYRESLRKLPFDSLLRTCNSIGRFDSLTLHFAHSKMFVSFRMFATSRVKHTLFPLTRQCNRSLTLTTHTTLGRESNTCPPHSHHHNTSFSFQHLVFRRFAQRGPFKKPPPASKSKLDSIIRNNRIGYPEMRVVYDDVTTGKTAWKIMKRGEALTFARSKSLDLVLGGVTVHVCAINIYWFCICN